MTFIFPGLPPASIQQLPMTSAIVVADAVSALLGTRARVKWPNDVLSGGRKLAGILVEASSRGAADADALVGIGINVYHTDETRPQPRATSLALEGVAEPDMALLAFRIGQGLSGSVESELSMNEVVDEYRIWSEHEVGDHLCCRVGDELIEGEFSGFGDDGSLLLDRRGQILRLRSSEIVEG